VTVYEYDGYQADKNLTASVIARMERVSTMLSKLLEEMDGIDLEAIGGDGDVVLSVNSQGQLTSLSLAQGCTTRYSHGALAELINTTIDEAVNAAAEETASVGGGQEQEALDAAVQAFIDPKSEIWTAT
jgi:DNA-binding protein YbaB